MLTCRRATGGHVQHRAEISLVAYSAHSFAMDPLRPNSITFNLIQFKLSDSTLLYHVLLCLPAHLIQCHLNQFIHFRIK